MRLLSSIKWGSLFSLTWLLVACSGDASTSGQATTSEGAGDKPKLLFYRHPMDPKITSQTPKKGSMGMPYIAVYAKSKKKKVILFYRHPMDPKITSKTPKKGSMGMPYIAVYAKGDGEAEDDNAVKISPSIVNNMGIRTTTVRQGTLYRKIDTVAFVQFDEDKMSHVHMRAKGWVKNLKVRANGERVVKGQLLYEFYSPDLVNAQEEYLQALRSNNIGLMRASKSKLLSLDVSVRQINSIAKLRKVNQVIQVYAQQSGVVSKLNAREGMYITPQRRVMTLADLSSVWLHVQVFESQSNWVKVGQNATVRIRYLPGLTLTGKVDYIYPTLDAKTRTLQVRLRFNNPKEKLKPNMYAMATIDAMPETNIVIIPREALIRTGKEQRVVIALGGGKFNSRKVVAGIESDEQVQIIKGLKRGEKVVTSGQFLIDSEASLKASLSRMTESKDNNNNMSKPKEKNMAKSMSKKSSNKSVSAKTASE
ncbi:Cobalt/zinc/cadmium efflux RND transporter, membrane fusion protein, CzcB family [hydrothermal vent metagenome]|uniref:Cobalt/zinc/cadmium efflux RND transporter, membrane fusion protein, CzcB family n=1 Tax=hydrothermal vent metagenome TaxID=652676 RepID=A0A3B0Y389_9ZZZZ